MKLFGRIALFVILPVFLCVAVVVMVRRYARPVNDTADVTTMASAEPAPVLPVEPPPVLPVEPPPKPQPREFKLPPGIEDYRDAGLIIPASLRPLAGECGAGIFVAPDRKFILWSKNDRSPMPIASITKLMSVLVAMETIQNDPRYTLATYTTISSATSRIGGRQLWLAPGHTYKLETLMRASILFSANDAIHAVAEGLSPNRKAGSFVAKMNRRARTLGMPTARFYNPHGLSEPHPNVASCRELVLLVLEVRKHPLICEWAKMTKGIFIHNNNKKVDMTSSNYDLLTKCPGVDGMKTGYTKAAGSCVAATCKRNGELLIAVVTGFKTNKSGRGKTKRYKFVSGLFDWGYSELAKMDQR